MQKLCPCLNWFKVAAAVEDFHVFLVVGPFFLHLVLASLSREDMIDSILSSGFTFLAYLSCILNAFVFVSL